MTDVSLLFIAIQWTISIISVSVPVQITEERCKVGFDKNDALPETEYIWGFCQRTMKCN